MKTLKESILGSMGMGDKHIMETDYAMTIFKMIVDGVGVENLNSDVISRREKEFAQSLQVYFHIDSSIIVSTIQNIFKKAHSISPNILKMTDGGGLYIGESQSNTRFAVSCSKNYSNNAQYSLWFAFSGNKEIESKGKDFLKRIKSEYHIKVNSK